MSLQNGHLSTEDSRVLHLAEMLIAELLRADMNRSYEIQRHELQTFYDDAMAIIKREQ